MFCDIFDCIFNINMLDFVKNNISIIIAIITCFITYKALKKTQQSNEMTKKSLEMTKQQFDISKQQFEWIKKDREDKQQQELNEIKQKELEKNKEQIEYIYNNIINNFFLKQTIILNSYNIKGFLTKIENIKNEVIQKKLFPEKLINNIYEKIKKSVLNDYMCSQRNMIPEQFATILQEHFDDQYYTNDIYNFDYEEIINMFKNEKINIQYVYNKMKNNNSNDPL